MRRVVDVLPGAIDEARQARDYYLSKSTAAEEAFRKELEHAVARRFVMHRFPFSVVYRTVDASSLIVAIAHAKRKPGYWRSRLK